MERWAAVVEAVALWDRSGVHAQCGSGWGGFQRLQSLFMYARETLEIKLSWAFGLGHYKFNLMWGFWMLILYTTNFQQQIHFESNTVPPELCFLISIMKKRFEWTYLPSQTTYFICSNNICSCNTILTKAWSKLFVVMYRHSKHLVQVRERSWSWLN